MTISVEDVRAVGEGRWNETDLAVRYGIDIEQAKRRVADIQKRHTERSRAKTAGAQ